MGPSRFKKTNDAADLKVKINKIENHYFSDDFTPNLSVTAPRAFSDEEGTEVPNRI
jgi:hypothetical protein